MVYRLVKTLLVLALSGLLPLALLSVYHFRQVRQVRQVLHAPQAQSGSSESPSTGILEVAEAWSSGSHAPQMAPVHLCGACILAKNLRGAAPTASSLAAPLSSSTAILALASEKSTARLDSFASPAPHQARPRVQTAP